MLNARSTPPTPQAEPGAALRHALDGGHRQPCGRRHAEDRDQPGAQLLRQVGELAEGGAVIRGWVMASGGWATRVDVSQDGGRSLVEVGLQLPDSPWNWAVWSSELNPQVGERELVARDWDPAGQTQPLRLDDTWNVEGYLSAAWHRVRVKVA